jgi:hypothetical protein
MAAKSGWRANPAADDRPFLSAQPPEIGEKESLLKKILIVDDQPRCATVGDRLRGRA